MSNAINTALSGAQAAITHINIDARNTANTESTQTINADGAVEHTPYIPEVAVQQTAQGGGVRAYAKPLSPQTATYAAYDPSNPDADAKGIVQKPDVDPVATAADLITGATAFKAALNVVKADDSTTKSLLNAVNVKA